MGVKLANKFLAFLDDRYNQAFLVVLLVGVLMRLKYFFMESIWNDASVHLWYSIKILRMPSFIFTAEFLAQDYVIPQTITALFYIFTQNIFIAGKLMALSYAVIGIVFMYLLGAELKDKLTGLIMAVIFMFNPLMWFYTIRPLSDGPLAVMFVVVAYCVIKLEKEKTNFWVLATVGAIFAAMLTKMPAILLLVSFLIYFGFRYKQVIKEKAIQRSIGLLLSIFVVSNVLYYIGFKKWLISAFFNKFFTFDGLTTGFEGLGFIPHMLSWYVIILFVIGLMFILFYRATKYYFVMITAIVFWFYFEFSVTSFDRYLLPLIPLIITIAAFGLIESAEIARSISKQTIVKYVLILFVLFVVCSNYNSYGSALIDSKVDSYAGYQEAGEWIKKNVPETNSVVFVGSPRSIRAFSEREVHTNYAVSRDGELVNLRSDYYLANRDLFYADVNAALAAGKEVYLEIDVWEYTQPSWYFPLSQESMNDFVSQGFQPLHVVERETNTEQGRQSLGVIYLFKHTQ